MKNDIDKTIKNYFQDEVNNKVTPPLPHFLSKRKKKVKWDYMLLTACILSSFLVMIHPSTYNNAIRRFYIPMSQYEAFKETIPRVIFDASLYFKSKKES